MRPRTDLIFANDKVYSPSNVKFRIWPAHILVHFPSTSLITSVPGVAVDGSRDLYHIIGTFCRFYSVEYLGRIFFG